MSWPLFLNPVVALSGVLGLLVLVAIGVGAVYRWWVRSVGVRS